MPSSHVVTIQRGRDGAYSARCSFNDLAARGLDHASARRLAHLHLAGLTLTDPEPNAEMTPEQVPELWREEVEPL